MKTMSTFLISLFLFNVITVVSAEPVEVTNVDLNITVLYDNFIFKEGLKADWGFACLIEGLDKTILFDVGMHGNILLKNAKELGVNLKDVDVVAISHDHRDHYGGMVDFLKENNQVDVYLLEAFSKQRSQTVQRYGATVVSVQEPLQICKGAWLTGEMGTQIKEQALVLDTTEGLVVITGCAHPGVVSIVKKAREIIPKNVHMVFGGFHMPRTSEDDIQDTIKTFRDIGVKFAGPTHCSGDRTIAMFGRAYGEKFTKIGVGKCITLAPSDTKTWMYLGQRPPAMTAEIFAKGIVSTNHHEHSAPAISPDGKEIFWSVWENPRPVNPVQKIYFVKLTDKGWTTPKVAPFSGVYSDGGPCFTYDNKKLFFSSRRPLNSEGPINDRDIWFVERTNSGWGPPKNLGAPVNTERGEGSPTLTNDGTLYFLAHYEGVKGNYGIYRSRKINGKYTKPEPLPKTINSSHYDWTPFISPDESYLIFASGRKGSYGFNDLYISFNKGNNNWTKPKNMGPVINNGPQVRFPAVSSDGKYLFFNRSTKEMHDDVFWIDAKIIDKFKSFKSSSNSTHSQPKKILRLGANNWYFWRKLNNGNFSGADVDIWREIARRNNLEIEYIFIPNLEKLKTAMENGSIDVFVSMRKNPEREQYMFFIEPPFRTKLKFLTYTRVNSNIKIDKFEDMGGKSIAMVGGGYDRINNNLNIEKINCGWNPSRAFEILLNKDVDAVHINQWLAADYFHDRKDKDKFELSNYTYSEYHACYMVMSRKSPLAGKWKDRFGQTIQQMIDDGTMKQIIDSYVPDWYESYPTGSQK